MPAYCPPKTTGVFPVLYYLVPLAALSPTWSVNTLVSYGGSASPMLPDAPSLPTIPLPCIGTSEGYANSGHTHPSTPPPKMTAIPLPAERFHVPRIHYLLAHTSFWTAHIQPFAWDLLYDPRTVRYNRPRVAGPDRMRVQVTHAAVRAAPEDGGQPYRSVLLVFHPLPLQVEVVPLRASTDDTSAGHPTYVSVWDIFTSLYSYLRAPVDHDTFLRLSDSQKERLRYNAAKRTKRLPEDRHPTCSHLIRNVDLLFEERRFLGIREAQEHELLKGRSSGEVFVVELGRS
ncbi:hypothetical protein C8Q79DRAFT_309063 [Trametes meyenii]|nr:hypothetical protein C8Q79DRAFT_309063 [Trametes meyenii]